MPNTSRPARLRRAALAAAAALLPSLGCKGVLDVNNPNNVIESSLGDPAAAAPLANGVVGITIRGVNAMLDPYSTVTDELDFVGSQDGFFQLDVGNVSTPVIQFSDLGFQRLAEARWTADQALGRFVAWDKAGTLPSANRVDYATTYLYAAVVYATIGDMFDDFAFSDRATAAAPVGEANMRVVYDTAVAYLDRGLAIATAANNVPLQQQILAVRARTKHARALWAKVKPPVRVAAAGPQPIASPFVANAGASADAQAALALVGATDWTFTVTPSSQGVAGNNLGGDLNQRREMRVGQAYAQPDPAAQGQNRTLVQNGLPVITLKDPITGQPDVALRNRVRDVINGGFYLPMILVSARELQLVLSEASLAAGDASDARTRINAVRTLAGSTGAWDGTNPAPLDMLRYMRRVHLFLEGRRLADMYRFGDRDPRWQTGSVAYKARGCFFPITYTERQSNPNPIPPPVCNGL